MSHITRIQTKIKDIKYLRQALRDQNYQFEEGALAVGGYFGDTETVSLAVRTGTGYDIGFRQKDEVYECVADWWGVEHFADIQQKQFLDQVTQRYAYHKTVDELENQGYYVASEEVTQENVIELVVRWQ
jgi:hypothetical protein